MNRTLLSVVLVVCLVDVMVVSAQDVPGRPAPSNVQSAPFPRIHSDGTVAFRIRADGASTVAVNLPDFGTVTMAKGEGGFWLGSTPTAVPPGFYYYTVNVDGFVSNDPGSQTFYGYARWGSALEVPDPSAAFADIRDVPHGAVREQWYFSKTMNQWRRIRVYTPPGYDTNPTVRYPVLYLQHGNGENETSWTLQGRANFILDNLLAEGRIRPMVVVHENGMVPGVAPAGRGGTPGAPPPIPYAEFDAIVSGELVPFIDANFRTIGNRQSRAIAGLSMGGGQAMRIGIYHLDMFASVGLFSPAVRNLQPATAYEGKLADADAINRQLALLWIGIGRQDFLYDAVKVTHENLEKAGIRHTWVESDGAHVWPVWRRHLAEFAPLLFR